MCSIFVSFFSASHCIFELCENGASGGEIIQNIYLESVEGVFLARDIPIVKGLYLPNGAKFNTHKMNTNCR